MIDKKVLDKIVNLINKSFIRKRNVRQYINNHSIKIEINDIGCHQDSANIRIAKIYTDHLYNDKEPLKITYLILNLDKKELITYYYDNSLLTLIDIQYICTQLDFSFHT